MHLKCLGALATITLVLAACIPICSAADALPAELASNVHVVHFHSAALGEERSFAILLPNDYRESADRYPTLYLLHGYDADFTSWFRGTNLSGLAAAHRHMIIVTPDASRGWYVNSAADPKARFEDYVIQDVVSYVDGHYRTIPERHARAIGGDLDGWLWGNVSGFETLRDVRCHRQFQRRSRHGP